MFSFREQRTICTFLMKFSYPDAKQIVCCGDVHGDFESLVFKICMQYDMHDTLVIVAGDCGFGFAKPTYYDLIYNRVSKRLNKNNIWIVMVRGNHDDPTYFQNQLINKTRWQTLPDYSIIDACNHTILCVGGAISIDRQWRLQAMAKTTGKQYYWTNEMPEYNEAALNDITNNGVKIDIVITHTAPSFCELQSKNGLVSWSLQDPNLLKDCEEERLVMDKIYKYLKTNNHPIKRWFYGHFHQSWHSDIDGIMFTMLDITELQEVY